MKNKSLWVFWAVLLLVSCKSPVEIGVRELAHGTQIRPHFEKGMEYKVVRRMSEKLSATGSPQGDWTMENSIDRHWNCTVSKIDREGNSHHDASLERLKVIYDAGPSGMQEYDSEGYNSGPMANHFKKYVNSDLSLIYAPNYAVTQAESKAGLMEASMFKKLENYSAEDWVREKYNLECIYPDGPVSSGGSWTKSWSVSSFYPMRIQANYTLHEGEAGQMLIKMTGEVKPHPDGIPTNEMGIRINYEWKGDISGTYTLDGSTGRLLNAEHNISVAGTCLMQLPDGSDTSFPVTLKQSETSRYTYQ